MAALVGLIGAVGAHAASMVDYDHAGGTITVTGSPGDNHLILEHDWTTSAGDSVVMISDDGEGSTLTAAATAAGCVASTSYPEWQCPRPARVVAHLGAADNIGNSLRVGEYLVPFTVPVEVHGGPDFDIIAGGSGDDLIYGGDGNDHLRGRTGHDQIFGQGGNDTINGDEGDDRMDGGPGNDEFEQPGEPAESLQGSDTYLGGPGTDSFSYFNRANPVTITIDGIANDGMIGEGDNIQADVETVGGSAGNDVITGSPGPNRLWGGGGNDVINGLGGDDQLFGDNGDDTIDGGLGNDELTGGCHADRLTGGPGADTFNSDSSTCSLLQRSTLDRIEAADGERDALIFCQQDGDPAGDTAFVDPVDPVVNSGPGACETINVISRSRSGGGGAAGAGGKAALKGKPRARLGKTLLLMTGTGKKGQAARMEISLKRKRLTLGTLRASKRTRVVTTAVTRRRGRTIPLGRAAVTLKARTTRTLRIRLSKRALRALKGQKRTRVITTFRVGKQRYREAFTVRTARR